MASEAVKKSDRPPDVVEKEREPAGTGAVSEEEGVDVLLGEPAHHARRPMNAFLIFCKRHRSVVRDRYPHLENRSITKILGEWWANLEPSEKGSYTELARQYKEAFLRANPDFKWYKLPAPPLRTLITRPSNQNKPHKLECQLTCGPITPGKLADESQMGGLSSLLASPPSTPTTLAPASPTVPKPPKKRYLQEAMLEANLAALPEVKLEEEPNEDLLVPQESKEKIYPDFKVNYPSPFTKLRNHAVNQLNSIQERKTNRRRSSADFKIMDTKTAFAKLKNTSNNLATVKSSSVIKSAITTNLTEKEVDDSVANSPSEKINPLKDNSCCNEKEELVNGTLYINSSKSLSLETTIKASQQQIIDRVVDKLCGFSESLQQQQPVSPTMCSATNAVSPQRSTISPPPKASVICSNIFVPNSLRSESIDSFAVVENCKYNADSENISSKNQECETRTINNNVYNKDAALEMHKSEEMSSCKSEAAYTNVFYTTSSTEEQSLEAKDWQAKNFGASAHYFESLEGTKISSDGNSENNCDNFSETAHVIPDIAEPKALETTSRLSCHETSAYRFPRTNSSESGGNFSNMFENDCNSQFVDVTENKMDLLPKFDPGLGIMEENRLVFPPLYSNNTTARTILVHNPQTSITKIDHFLSSDNEIKSLEHSPKFDSIESYKTLEHPIKSSPFSFVSKLPSKSANDSSSELTSVEVSRSNPSIECNGSSPVGLEMCTDNISKTVPIIGSESVNFVSNSYDITRPKKLAHCSPRSPLRVNLLTDTVSGANDINNSVKQDNCENENKPKTSQENIIGLSTEQCDELERWKPVKCILSEPTKLSPKSTGFLNITNEEVAVPQQQQQQQNQRRKSLRACKGQRYREFMNEGRLALGKRTKKALVTGGESGTHGELISAVSKRDRHESGSSTTSDRTESAFSEGSREMDLEWQQLQTAKFPQSLARKDSQTISKQQSNNKKSSAIGKTLSGFKDALSTAVNSPEKKSRKLSDASEDSFSDSSPKKRFRAADFNLDEKIEALPSLSLEEFQLKKKQRKKRNLVSLGGCTKKSLITTLAKASTSCQDPILQNNISENGLKRSQSPEERSLPKIASSPVSGSSVVTAIIATVTATTITNSSPARMTPLVGSQKRKARKQCIMRLDPENAHTSRDTAVVEPDVLNNIGLATLAEVAAAKRKLAK